MPSEITNSELINLIVNDNRYKSICKTIAGNRRHLADDLYQEGMLAILENKDDRLMNAYNQSRLEIFIVGILNNIWLNKDRAKSYENGQTSPLMEYSSTFNADSLAGKVTGNKHELWEAFENSVFDTHPKVRQVLNQESIDYNPKVDQVFEATKKIVREDCNSQIIKTWYPARVYNYSCNNIAELRDEKGVLIKAHSNAKQFAASSNIPYSSVYKAYQIYKQSLQQKLKHLLND